MSLSDIAHRVNELASSWEQFKLINNRRLEEIESKGHADSSTVEQLHKVNDAIDSCKERLDLIETAAQRPGVNTDFNTNDKDFSDYLRKGTENGLSQKALSGDRGGGGEYLVAPHILKRINKYITDASLMRQLCSRQKISTETFDYIIEDGEAGAGWSGDIKNRPDFTKDTETPRAQRISITTYELYAQPQISQKLLDDAFVDVESWLVGKIVETFGAKKNQAFIKGKGTFEPKGILSYDPGESYNTIEQFTEENLYSDAIISLYYALNEHYSKNASFLMSRRRLKDIRLLKYSGTGQYMWQPSLSLDEPDTLMGVPVYQSIDMPDDTIVVADFKRAYKIVDGRGMRILRDPYTNKPHVRFFITKRVGGEVVNTSAIKILKSTKKEP
ncbi:phage major capsid protein [Wolbachia endosymbiont of Ctenocephalides felis wCfeT]|uniref:phage major capsid protein n=1 Tax=Wolbachia endosymbiont of Ctenocephalides felis wCfeT TaxID=2732593 RepID=UPI001447EA02